MYDYYCYLCASEQVSYRSRSGNWDKYFAIKALKKFLETKFNVSADVLQILFRHITRLDINQFQADQAEVIGVVNKICPQVQMLSFKQLTPECLNIVCQFQYLEKIVLGKYEGNKNCVLKLNNGARVMVEVAETTFEQEQSDSYSADEASAPEKQ